MSDYVILGHVCTLQVVTLDKALAIHPDTRWWVKADGCDLVNGLEQSVKLELNGDADYGTSAVQELYDLAWTQSTVWSRIF